MESEKKSKAGAPPFFKKPEEMQKKIEEYFNSGMKMKKVLVGKAPNQELVEMPAPTISGLCYFLGFESRQSFYDYEERPKFSYTIKRARFAIEVEYETNLQLGNVTGAIFALKNMGWDDKSHQDQNVTVTIRREKK